MIRPEIIIYTDEVEDTVLKEVLAGIEEEGLPFRVFKGYPDEDAKALARRARYQSQLDVGIGICDQEVQLMVKGIEDSALMTAIDSWRIVGHNAARYVKGNILKEGRVE